MLKIILIINSNSITMKKEQMPSVSGTNNTAKFAPMTINPNCFQKLDLAKWDLSQTVDISTMFQNTIMFEDITDYTKVFSNCKSHP